MDLTAELRGMTVTLTFTKLGVVEIEMGPIKYADLPKWRTFAALDADFTVDLGHTVSYSDGILTFEVGVRVRIPVGMVPGIRQKLAALVVEISRACTPAMPPYPNRKFGGDPVLCARCGDKMKYDFTGPFCDRWYYCSECKLKYCDYDGMYESL
jgi:hypothetical protein